MGHVLAELSELDLSRDVLPDEELRRLVPHDHEFRMLDGICHLDLERGLVIGYKDFGEDAWAEDFGANSTTVEVEDTPEVDSVRDEARNDEPMDDEPMDDDPQGQASASDGDDAPPVDEEKKKKKKKTEDDDA